MFLWANTEEFNNHYILPSLWGPSDHAPLVVYIVIEAEFIQKKKQAIVKNSKEEKAFINELRNIVGHIDLTNISNHEVLEGITQEFTFIIEKLWYKHSKILTLQNITKHYKAWWNNEYNRDLTIYWVSRNRID